MRYKQATDIDLYCTCIIGQPILKHDELSCKFFYFFKFDVDNQCLLDRKILIIPNFKLKIQY